MATFPQEIDVGKSGHLLFEAGSLLFTIFGALFVLSLPVIGMFSKYHLWVRPTILAASLFALLTLNGLALLYFSSTVEQHGT